MDTIHIVIIALGVLLAVCIVLLLCTWRTLRIKRDALRHYYRAEHQYYRARRQAEKEKPEPEEKLKRSAAPTRAEPDSKKRKAKLTSL